MLGNGSTSSLEYSIPKQAPEEHLESSTDHLLFKHLEALFQSSFDGVWVCDGSGTILQLNPASEKINNLLAGDWIGRNVSQLAQEGYIDRPVTLEVIEQKRQVTIIQQSLKTGKKLLVTGSPIFNSAGEVEMVITNDRDITELDNLRLKLLDSEARNERFQDELIQRDLEINANAEFIGRSSKTRKLLTAALRVAKFKTNVLLTGPSGTGKSLLARLIHIYSDRGNKPFVRVECGSIPTALFESEVFGYEKGAFTGASQSGKPGLFEMAEGGTLFLDEVDLAPFDLQHKLLRFMETGELIRVGSIRPIKLDIRLIAASNADLELKVEAGLFRNDLLFRLKVVPLELSPLKERAEEIPFLVQHFLEKMNRLFLTDKIVSLPAIEAMAAYDWPGNVRELENLIERLVVMSPGRVIDVRDLPESITQNTALSPTLIKGQSLKQAVRDFEAQIIDMAVKKLGSQAKAAEVLKVSPATITRKKNQVFQK